MVRVAAEINKPKLNMFWISIAIILRRKNHDLTALQAW